MKKYLALLTLIALTPHSAMAQIDADFSLGGAIRVGGSATVCNSSALGGIRYSSAGGGKLEFCNGATWGAIGANGAIGIDDLTDAIARYSSQSMYLGQGTGVNNTGNNNTVLGNQSLVPTGSGGNNTAVGSSALQNNSAGGSNTAVGAYALNYNTTGNHNSAVGYSALFFNTTGLGSTALGSNALLNNSSGGTNTAVGYGALSSNTTGNNNNALGSSALSANTTGSNNTAVGSAALQQNTANGNTAVGQGAMYKNTTGNNNSALGQVALYEGTTGSYNTALGTGLFIATSPSRKARPSAIMPCITPITLPRPASPITPLSVPTRYKVVARLQTIQARTTQPLAIVR